MKDLLKLTSPAQIVGPPVTSRLALLHSEWMAESHPRAMAEHLALDRWRRCERYCRLGRPAWNRALDGLVPDRVRLAGGIAFAFREDPVLPALAEPR